MSTSLLSVAKEIRDHGIAIRKGVCFGIRPWRDAATGRDYVYCAINGKPSMVVQVDVITGRCRSFVLPAPCSGPWQMAFTVEGHLLVTSVSGHLARIDPSTGKVWITANPGKWLWTIDRGMDGKFYLGSSPACGLFRYDPTTEQVEDLGSVDTEQGYLRHVLDGGDGYIYCSIGSAAGQMIAYHIATKRLTRLLPKREVKPGFLDQCGRAADGNIYVQTKTGTTYRLSHGEAFPVKSAGQANRVNLLPDGRPVAFVDPDTIRIGEGRMARLVPIQYETDGADIFHLAEGPNQAVYASTIYPLNILRYTPATDKLENLGRGGPDRAEAYSIGHSGGKLYYGTYSQALLMTYDPAKPLHKDPPGAMKWKTNPVLLGYLGKGNCRPRAMSIDAQQRVWVGGTPEYGFRHGGLACYDIQRKKLTVYDKVTPDQSIGALAADETGDILYGATNTGRGGGMKPVTTDAQIFAWDARRKKVLWRAVAPPGISFVANLLYRDGKLYGTGGLNFFRFDVRTRKTDYLIPSAISAVRDISMCFGPDGNIYGITWMVLFRWRPEGQIEELYRCVGDDAKPYGGSLFHRGSVIVKDRFYFSCGPRVMSLRLPFETNR